MTRPTSILEGIGTRVDEWLRIAPAGSAPHYQHIDAATRLSRREAPISGTTEFLHNCYEQIHSNWEATKDNYSNPSRQNWRWKQNTRISAKSTSQEVRLERAIVRQCGANWSNQMPTASGLIGPATHKHNAVDLVHREDLTTYSFIELKVASNTPLYAAIEILQYGLLFVWSRTNANALGYGTERQPVLGANSITLCVLAPVQYYAPFDLTKFTVALNDGLAEFGKDKGLALNFQFAKLGVPRTAIATLEDVRPAVNNQRAIWMG